MKKTIVLGVSGGIAVFKAAQLTSNLIKKGYDVEVIMTQNATEFMTPLTFESLTKHNVMVSTFEKVADRSVKHISLAKRADLFVVVPATANVIAKFVCGIADDMLTTTFLAANCPKVICPAMNTQMYENPVTQRNLKTCKELGYHIVEPASGFLACGDCGKGKLAELSDIEACIDSYFQTNRRLEGKHVLITAGPTQEALDPVRYISNHSSGKMGYELARAARSMGACVTLISGPSREEAPFNVQLISVQSALDMLEAVKAHYISADYIIKAAAVGDYRVESVAEHKIKKDSEEFTLKLVKNPDILAYLGEHIRKDQILCGFAMETQNLIENAKAKLEKKHCDMIVANNLKTEGAGFGHNTNIVTLIEKEQLQELSIMSKYEVACKILERLAEIREEKGVQ
ncbi:MAG: bifunctional phosphopantothenoylcysteine decarboxylase/phosphopantothenate--cysteine ligase CoaBC [Amedibacillus dolichus]|uniref:Coenzyme A biosynthesis bifunctional protein CoaBC n=1 Tax=Amedibacillus dolichus TaxID=31971 RepID=A0A942ZXM1_9FIRM|nr:bifunctional phosphopantothenoylcysteine decarboxylase/phosphopantothenate--cysteine ligase CoaBC [Amedibacillus dolichus]MBS4884474.1 bifunctional phosphopantothenoylcysteine decarboxylase/phosphopantothenate--cysteine ligase CoaBC [Amedibacillus dolichus]